MVVKTVRTLQRTPLISMAVLTESLCRERRNFQQEPKEYPGEDVYNRWVPDWPPPGYALVIEVPMSAETYFPIWCSEVPVQAPKQVEMDKPKEETV